MFVALGKLAFDIVMASSRSGVPEESNKQMSLYQCFTDIMWIEAKTHKAVVPNLEWIYQQFKNPNCFKSFIMQQCQTSQK